MTNAVLNGLQRSGVKLSLELVQTKHVRLSISQNVSPEMSGDLPCPNDQKVLPLLRTLAVVPAA